MMKAVEEREREVIRFAGDAGDGMRLAGSRFTDATAVMGNDLATLPTFPAEIRGPVGSSQGAIRAGVRRARELRVKFLVDVGSFTKVKGQPLFAAEIEQRA